MFKKYIRYSWFLILILVVSCAKRGTITGGSKDTLAPVLKTSFPKNFSANFKGNEIKLTFDEYVKLKNLNKQLVVSPPMQTMPTISPTTASKTLSITINDTLQPNTTYSFNFGQSIEDNNESNPYPQFRYVFSTGSYIDSLSLSGKVKDALNKEVASFVSVMLYEVNPAFKDSVVYKSAPKYLTNTLDSLKTFKLDNLKSGKYLLVAMKDVNNNNKFDPKEDKIGFHPAFVTIPNDTLFEMELFKEAPTFKAVKPIQASGNRLLLGYEGKAKNLNVILRNKNEIVPTIITQFPKKDSVQIWYKPIKADSLNLAVTKEKYSAKFTFKIKDQKKDSLSFTPKQSGILPLDEKFTLVASRPLVKFDASKIKITDKDSAAVAFTTDYDIFTQQFVLNFKKEPLQKYHFTLLPGALTDYLEQANDTLSYRLNTKSTSDYGNLRVNLQNVKQFPVIVELTTDKGDVIATAYSEKNTTLDFNNLNPALYILRIIYDENKNKEWDTGNYLEKRQSEEVLYFPTGIDVRANWDVEQVFDLKTIN